MQNTKNKILIILLLLLLMATNIFGTEKWLISSGMAGDIKIGNSVDKLKIHSSMKLKKSVKTMQTEEGDSKEPIYTLSDNKDQLLEIYLKYDYNQSKYNNKIGELSVISDKYQTSKGIGIGSAIKDFAKAYPKNNLWYTYVSDRFVIETSELKNVQFIVDGKGYKGSQDKLYNSDSVNLSFSKFLPETKIVSIRIF